MATGSLLVLVFVVTLSIFISRRIYSKIRWSLLAKTMLVSWAFGIMLILGKILSPNRGFPQFRDVSTPGDFAVVVVVMPIVGIIVGLVFSPAIGLIIWSFEKFALPRLQHWRLTAIFLAVGLSVTVGMSVGWASGIFVDPAQSENPFALLMHPAILAVTLVAAGLASGSVYALMSRNPIDA